MPKPTDKDIRDLDGRLYVKEVNERLAREKELEVATGRPAPTNSLEWMRLAASYNFPHWGDNSFDENLIWAWVMGREDHNKRLDIECADHVAVTGEALRHNTRPGVMSICETLASMDDDTECEEMSLLRQQARSVMIAIKAEAHD